MFFGRSRVDDAVASSVASTKDRVEVRHARVEASRSWGHLESSTAEDYRFVGED
jgi:hypothetical protein